MNPAERNKAQEADQQNTQLRSELRSLTPNKEAITKITIGMLNGAYNFPYLSSDTLDQEYSDKRIVEIFDKEGKSDRNATFGAVIHYSLISARKNAPNFPPYGLIKSTKDEKIEAFNPVIEPNAWEAADIGMRGTLSHYIKNEVIAMSEEAKVNPTSNRAKIFQNLHAWGNFERNNIQPFATDWRRIVSGAFAASSFIMNELRAIPQIGNRISVSEPEETRELAVSEYIKRAASTRKTLGELVNLELNIFEEMRSIFIGKNGTISTQNFIFTEHPNDPKHTQRVDLTPEVYRTALGQIKVDHTLLQSLNNKTKTGCPAASTDALDEVYNWAIEIATDIWRKNLGLPSNKNPQALI